MNTQTALAIDDFIDVSNRLTELMTAEITSLRAMRPKDIAPLRAEKAALTERYNQYLQAFRSDDPAAPRAANSDERAHVREAVTRLTEVARTNSLALQAARTVNERLVKHVAQTVTQQTNSSAGYGATGAAPQPSPVRGDSVVSVTLNTQI